MTTKKQREAARRATAQQAYNEVRAAQIMLEHLELQHRQSVPFAPDPVTSPKSYARYTQGVAEAAAAVTDARERLAKAERLYASASRFEPPPLRKRGRPRNTGKAHDVETNLPGRERRRARPGERAFTLLRVARLHVRGKASRADLADAFWLLRASRQHDPNDNLMRGRARAGARRKKVLLRWELEVVYYLKGKRTREQLRKALPKGRLDRIALPLPGRRIHPALLRGYAFD
jgi:hypothetical protein